MCRSSFLNNTRIWEWRDLLRQARRLPDWMSAWTLRAHYISAARSFDSTAWIAKPLLNATCFLFQSMTFSHFGGTFKRPDFFSSNFKAPPHDTTTKQDIRTNCLLSEVCKMYWLSGMIPIFFLSSKLPVHLDTRHYVFPCSSHPSKWLNTYPALTVKSWPLQSNWLPPWHCLSQSMGRRNEGSNRKALLIFGQVMVDRPDMTSSSLQQQLKSYIYPVAWSQMWAGHVQWRYNSIRISHYIQKALLVTCKQ